MNSDIYWMWLSSIDIFSNRNSNILLKYFKSPQEIWNASDKLLKSIKGVSPNYIEKLIHSKNMHDLETKLSDMQNRKVKYISIENEEYPYNLKNIYDYPYGLYFKGSSKINLKKCVAIVGSRNCTEYGANIAKTMSKQLAQNNITVVSGMASGIDSFSHIGAIESGVNNCTIAVLGCGIDICYPKQNYALMNKIIEFGTIISEYPIGISPHPAFFPRRNRIISGISEAVVVVEASIKSGSLITANLALEQGKEVCAVPGNINNKLSEGTNDIIKQGAFPITSYSDILELIGFRQNRMSESKLEKIDNKDFLAPDEKLVYDCISLEPKNIDTIFDKLDYKIDKLQYILTMLELKGLIKQLPAQRYMRIL